MGSKRVLLPTILDEIKRLQPAKVLDAFSGSACVSYGLKTLGIEVHSNDLMLFASKIAIASVQNNDTLLADSDVARLLRTNPKADDFVQRTFGNLYFDDEDNAFLDSLWANIEQLRSPLKRSLALTAACRAAMKKRPRGIFTYTGHKSWDSRRDLTLSMREQFLLAVNAFNGAVFSNRKKNQTFQQDVFALDPKGYDLVYIDTPYVSPYSDCDYTRRYHFVEGYCSYWRNAEVMHETTTKKIRSHPTAFASKNDVERSFHRLFHHFRRSTLMISYSSNAVPSKEVMCSILRNYKRSVTVLEKPHRYSFGNQGHKVGKNKNSVCEYLFIAE
jgi:DNA adenine methylase